MRLFVLCIISSFFVACRAQAPLETASDVDLQRYLGRWHEIARLPQSFQRGCVCTTAEYSITQNGNIKVLNHCRLNSPTGKIKSAEGQARVVQGSNNSKLRVSFFRPFYGKYWILERAEDYSYAVVGHPNRKYLWILSRTPQMDTALLNGIIDRARKNGFDTGSLIITQNHGCSFNY
jgi:apolipoprotein D and lipocalin family protein